MTTMKKEKLGVIQVDPKIKVLMPVRDQHYPEDLKFPKKVKWKEADLLILISYDIVIYVYIVIIYKK